MTDDDKAQTASRFVLLATMNVYVEKFLELVTEGKHSPDIEGELAVVVRNARKEAEIFCERGDRTFLWELAGRLTAIAANCESGCVLCKSRPGAGLNTATRVRYLRTAAGALLDSAGEREKVASLG